MLCFYFSFPLDVETDSLITLLPPTSESLPLPTLKTSSLFPNKRSFAVRSGNCSTGLSYFKSILILVKCSINLGSNINMKVFLLNF